MNWTVAIVAVALFAVLCFALIAASTRRTGTSTTANSKPRCPACGGEDLECQTSGLYTGANAGHYGSFGYEICSNCHGRVAIWDSHCDGQWTKRVYVPSDGEWNESVSDKPEPYVKCNECLSEITVELAFDSALASWPNQSVITFKCRECECLNVLLVSEDSVSKGYEDNLAETCFVAKSHVAIPGLRVHRSAAEIRITNLTREWVIPHRK